MIEKSWNFHTVLWRVNFHTLNTVLLTQCGKFRIFLPLRFYVKSNQVILGAQRLQFWPFWRLTILKFLDFLPFSNMEFPQKSKFMQTKLVKIALFELLKLPNLISRKTWVAVKFLDFHTVVWKSRKFSVTLFWQKFRESNSFTN